MASLNERLGEVVKMKRQRDRLTQAELGARIGVSGSYIGSIEAATTGVRITELEALASVFRTTAFELITEAAGQTRATSRRQTASAMPSSTSTTRSTRRHSARRVHSCCSCANSRSREMWTRTREEYTRVAWKSVLLGILMLRPIGN